MSAGLYLSNLLNYSTRAQVTLLGFVVMVIQKNYPEADKFVVDLGSVSKAHRVDITSMQEDITALEKGLKVLEAELEAFRKTNQKSKFPEDRYDEVMGPFQKSCRTQVEQIRATYVDIESKTLDVCKFFGCEGKELTELLDIWDSFCTDYLETKDELETMRVKEEKERKKAELAAAEEEKKKKKAQEILEKQASEKRKELAKSNKSDESKYSIPIPEGDESQDRQVDGAAISMGGGAESSAVSVPDVEEAKKETARDTPKTATAIAQADAQATKREEMMKRLAAQKAARAPKAADGGEKKGEEKSKEDQLKAQTQGESAHAVLANARKSRENSLKLAVKTAIV
jgi:hypothetical protein